MLFVLLFVLGMLCIPVMVDTRQHPRDNILRRSDRDLLQFKIVASIVRHISPSQVHRISEAFPGAVMLSFILGLILLMYVGVFTLIVIFPIVVGLLGVAVNLFALSFFWLVGKLLDNVIGFGGLGILILIIIVILVMRSRAGRV
jgi:hypothetical protein